MFKKTSLMKGILMKKSVLIVGAGSGLSASLAKLFHKEDMSICLAARNVSKLGDLSQKTSAFLFQCDTSKPKEVENLFKFSDENIGVPEIVIFNPSSRVRGPVIELDPEETKKALDITCFGGFLVAREAAIRMVRRGSGSIFFTSASAGIKGFANSSVFAMGKFGLRGLAQSMARELHPKNIHIGHFVIDGGISTGASSDQSTDRKSRNDDGSDKWLNPDEIAKTYLDFHRQHRSSWAWEIELRPWVENF